MANAFTGTVSNSQKMGTCTTVNVQSPSSSSGGTPPSSGGPSTTPSPSGGVQLPFGLNLIDVVVAGAAVGAAVIALFYTGVF